jgi:hypothetical protein
MEKKKLFYIGGGILFAGVIIGARLIYLNNYMTTVAQENFTPEVMNEITNGNPQSLYAPVEEVDEEEIKQSWEQMMDDIPTEDLQQYLDEYGY